MVDAIDGGVITVKVDSSTEVTLSIPPILIDA
jgi:hypothetical protein